MITTIVWNVLIYEVLQVRLSDTALVLISVL